jgi:hypothetical protein
MLKIASSNISPVREIDKDHLSTTFLVHPWYALWNDTIGWAGLVWVLMGNSKNWSICDFSALNLACNSQWSSGTSWLCSTQYKLSNDITSILSSLIFTELQLDKVWSDPPRTKSPVQIPASGSQAPEQLQSISPYQHTSLR